MSTAPSQRSETPWNVAPGYSLDSCMPQNIQSALKHRISRSSPTAHHRSTHQHVCQHLHFFHQTRSPLEKSITIFHPPPPHLDLAPIPNSQFPLSHEAPSNLSPASPSSHIDPDTETVSLWDGSQKSHQRKVQTWKRQIRGKIVAVLQSRVRVDRFILENDGLVC